MDDNRSAQFPEVESETYLPKVCMTLSPGCSRSKGGTLQLSSTHTCSINISNSTSTTLQYYTATCSTLKAKHTWQRAAPCRTLVRNWMETSLFRKQEPGWLRYLWTRKQKKVRPLNCVIQTLIVFHSHGFPIQVFMRQYCLNLKNLTLVESKQTLDESRWNLKTNQKMLLHFRSYLWQWFRHDTSFGFQTNLYIWTHSLFQQRPDDPSRWPAHMAAPISTPIHFCASQTLKSRRRQLGLHTSNLDLPWTPHLIETEAGNPGYLDMTPKSQWVS